MINLSNFKRLKIDNVDLKRLLLNGVEIWRAYKNWVRYSTESDGVTIYNNGLGYKNGYRVRSGGAEGAYDNASCTGYIPVSGGDVVRLCGWNFSYTNNGNAINVSDNSKTNIGQFTMHPAKYGIFLTEYGGYDYSSVVEESSGVWKWVVPPEASGVAYIRVTGMTSADGSKMIVTINEEIT